MKTRYDIEIDLHGLNFEDAVRKIESVIYFESSGCSILVIHGVGSGALREKVREYIRGNEFISDYLFGEDLNLPGGVGVTVIYL